MILTGISADEVSQGNQAIWVFLLFGFCYLVLAAQYESFILPLSVILSLPAGIFGAFLLLKLTGLENNIYAQVAMVMLIDC
jgi:HAE1 family hydrophobic/amphiphilic exporter-1